MKQSSWMLLSLGGSAALVGVPAAAQVPPAAPAPAAAPAVAPAPAATPAVTLRPAVEPAAPPAVELPPAPPPTDPAAAALPSGGEAKLHLRSTQPGVSFLYAKLARPNPDFTPVDWTQLCLGECDVRLAPGYYRLALSSGAGEPVPAPRIFQPTAGTRLEGVYSDNKSTRLAGVLVLAIGGVSSLATATTGGMLAKTWGNEDIGTATLVGGIVGTLLSLAIGIPLAATSDEARVYPLGAAALAKD
jgi:hypothetical protein